MCRVKTGKEDCENRRESWTGVLVSASSGAGQLGCVVLTLQEEGPECVQCSPLYWVPCVRECLAFAQGSSQTCSLLIPKKDSWQIAQRTDGCSEGIEKQGS